MATVLRYARILTWLLMLLPPIALWLRLIDLPAMIGIFFTLLAVAEVLGHFLNRRLNQLRKEAFVKAWFEAGGENARIEDIEEITVPTPESRIVR